jgi:hypothetical protein
MSHVLECLDCGKESKAENSVSICKKCGGLMEYRLVKTKIQFKGPINFWRYRSPIGKWGRDWELSEGAEDHKRASKRYSSNRN